MRLAHTPFTPYRWARALQLTLLGLAGLLSACDFSSTPDTTPPSVTLSASPLTLTAAGPVTLTATATDNVNVTKVEFYEGTTLLATDDTVPYTTSVNLSTAGNGAHQYSATAYDSAGNKATAQAPQVQVNIPGPVLSLTASQRTLASASGSTTITASSAVSWTISSGGGTLSNITDTSVTYSAPAVTGDTIVAVKATSKADPSLSAQLPLIVIAPTVVNSISVSADPATIGNNATSTLTAKITGTGNPNPNAKWEIVSGGGALSASSGASVTYAPPTVTADTTVTIKATSVDDSSKSATTTITVKPGVTITGITATAAQTTLISGTTAQLSATVTGSAGADLGVKWSVVSGGGSLSSASGATITYTAPNVTTSTKIQVKAESVQDASKSTLIDLTVNPKPAVTVTVTPSPATVKSAQKITLTGAVANASNQNLTWTVVSGGGTIMSTDASGKQAEYTAPTVTSDTSVSVKATSVEDPSKTATATITVKAPVLSLRVVWLDFRYLDPEGYSADPNGTSVNVPLGGLFHVWALKDGVEVNTPVTFSIADTSVAMIHHTNGGGLALIGGIKANASTTLSASVDGLKATMTMNVGAVQVQKPASMYPLWAGMSFIRPDGLYGYGDVTGMGFGPAGQPGGELDPPMKLPVPVQVIGGSGGYNHNLAVSNTGQVYAAGNPENGTGQYQVNWVNTGISGIALTVGHYHTNYYVSNDAQRRVFSNGENDQGQACQGTGATTGLTGYGSTGGTGASRLIAGVRHVMLINPTGQLWTCGSNTYGELGKGNAGGPVSTWGTAQAVPAVIDCAAEDGISVCITPSRQLVVFGRQPNGLFGIGSTSNIVIPVLVPGLNGVLEVKCHMEKCVVRTWDGLIYGAGKLEGLGLPPNSYANWTQIPIADKVIQLSMSEYRGLFLRKEDDTYYKTGHDVLTPLAFGPPNIIVAVDKNNFSFKQRDTPIIIATVQGTSFSKVNFTSENKNIVDIEPVYQDGHPDSAIKLYWKSAGSTRIVAQSALGGIPTYINVTAQGNDPPQIKRFYELNGNYNPAPWDSLTLKWEITDPNGDSMNCMLDLNGDNQWDYAKNGCTDLDQYVHLWNNLQTGARSIRLHVEDSQGGATDQTLGFDVRANNNPPVIASFTANPSSGSAPLATTFSWSVSDPDNDALTCQLDLNGDGTFDPAFACSSRSSQTYTYTTNGTYTAKLKVTDGRGGETSAVKSITAGNNNGGTPVINRLPIISTFEATPDGQVGIRSTGYVDVLFTWSIADPDGDNITCQFYNGFNITLIDVPCDSGMELVKVYIGDNEVLSLPFAVLTADSKGGRADSVIHKSFYNATGSVSNVFADNFAKCTWDATIGSFAIGWDLAKTYTEIVNGGLLIKPSDILEVISFNAQTMDFVDFILKMKGEYLIKYGAIDSDGFWRYVSNLTEFRNSIPGAKMLGAIDKGVSIGLYTTCMFGITK